MTEVIRIHIDSAEIDEAFEEWLDEVSYDGDVETGEDGLPILHPEPEDPDDDYATLEVKHGSPDRPGYHLLHPDSVTPHEVEKVDHRFYTLRHRTTRSTQVVFRDEVLADTAENVAAQRNDPHYRAVKALEEATGAEVDLWRLDPELIDPVVEAFTEEVERHPQLRGFIKRIHLDYLNEHRYAQWSVRDRAVTFNHRWFGTTLGRPSRTPELREALARNARDGMHPRSMTEPKSLVVHEIGHALHQLAGPKFNADLGDALEGVGIRGDGLTEAGWEAQKKRLGEEVSLYAASDWHELIAEAYGDYRAPGPDQSPLSTLIGSMLDDAVLRADGTAEPSVKDERTAASAWMPGPGTVSAIVRVTDVARHTTHDRFHPSTSVPHLVVAPRSRNGRRRAVLVDGNHRVNQAKADKVATVEVLIDPSPAAVAQHILGNEPMTNARLSAAIDAALEESK